MSAFLTKSENSLVPVKGRQVAVDQLGVVADSNRVSPQSCYSRLNLLNATYLITKISEPRHFLFVHKEIVHFLWNSFEQRFDFIISIWSI